MMENLLQHYKKLYEFENWCVTNSEGTSTFRSYAIYLKQNDSYQRISQEVNSPMWGESLYTHCERIAKGNIHFFVKIWPYYTIEKAKEGMLLRMVSSVPFEKAEDIKIGDLCYMHPCFPSSYLLLLNGSTMIEISVSDRGEHMDDIKELASLIVSQMKDVQKRQNK